MLLPWGKEPINWHRLHKKTLCDLRTIDMDRILLDFIRATKFDHMGLDKSLVEYIVCWRATHTENESQHDSNVSELRVPNKKIIECFVEHVLVEQLFAYLSRFPRSNPEQMADAFERLEAGVLSVEHDRRQRKWRFVNNALNYFRLAQKIRNEFGTVRRNSRPNCFDSFESIVELETEPEFPFSILVHHVLLKAANRRHTLKLYHEMRTRAQLLHIQKLLLEVDFEDFCDDYFFGGIFEKIEPTTPTWKEVKTFLRSGYRVHARREVLFFARVSDEELDEALCCLLNFWLRTLQWTSKDPIPIDETVERLEEFLTRGASLFFKDPEEEFSSLGAFSRLICGGYSWTLASFRQYICCPLELRGNSLVSDHRRVASLTCLAARKINSSLEDLVLPHTLRSFIVAHQELWFPKETERIEYDPRIPDPFYDIFR